MTMPHRDLEARREYQRRWWRERGKGLSKKYLARSCPICQRIFNSAKHVKTCSRSCGVKLAHTEHRMPTFEKGQRPHNWKGGRSTTKAGYVYILKRDHPRARENGYVLEHTVVAEKMLGRSPLSSCSCRP